MSGQLMPFRFASTPHAVRLAPAASRVTSMRSNETHPPVSTVRTTVSVLPAATVAGASSLLTPSTTICLGASGLQAPPSNKPEQRSTDETVFISPPHLVH